MNNEYLCRHNFWLRGNQGLTDFSRPLVTFLVWNLNRGCHWNILAWDHHITEDKKWSVCLTFLYGNIDALLSLHLDRDGDAFLRGDVLETSEPQHHGGETSFG